jgi:hypothetical protein
VLCRVISVLTLLLVNSSATTIVVIRTPEHLVVAADSLIVTWGPGSATLISHVCKLHQQDATFFAIEGMSIVYAGTGFSAEQLARQAVAHTASLEQAGLYFARIAAGPYGRVMTIMRRVDRRGWNLIAQHRGHGIPLVAVFFGIEQGVPKYVIVGFRVSIGKRIAVVADVASCPGSACGDESDRKQWTILGQAEAAYHEMGGGDHNSFARFQQGHSDAQMARSLISIEEQSAPDTVGGPINIVTVDASGAHWNAPSGHCPCETR